MSDDLTTAQVAERFNVTPANVRLWCKRGLFPSAREVQESRGSVWRIPEKDLKGFEPPKKTGRPPKTAKVLQGEKRKRAEAGATPKGGKAGGPDGRVVVTKKGGGKR